MAGADGGRFSRLDRKERYGKIVHRKVWYRRHVGVPFGSGEQRNRGKHAVHAAFCVAEVNRSLPGCFWQPQALNRQDGALCQRTST